MQSKYKFVAHRAGTFEGTAYNNILLSNGIRTLSFKNKTNQDDLLKTFLEGEDVNCELSITFGAKHLDATVLHIEKAKK